MSEVCIQEVKDELKCLFPERPLLCCDVFAVNNKQLNSQ